MDNKIVILVLTIAANVCGVVMAQHVFASGSPLAKAMAVLGAVLVNVLALFGHPIASGKSNDGGLELPPPPPGGGK